MKLLIAVAVLATTGYAAPQPQEGTEATAASALSQLQDENIVIGAPVPLGDLESASTSIPPLADTPSATASVPAAPDASAPPELPEGAFAVGAGTPDAGPGSGSGSETAPEVVDQQLPAAAGATGAPLPGVDVSGLSTEGVTTVETVVDRFLTYVSGPTVFTTNGAVYSVTGAGTVTVTDCPCTITTTRCLGANCYYKGPTDAPDASAADVLATGITARPSGLGDFNQTLVGSGEGMGAAAGAGAVASGGDEASMGGVASQSRAAYAPGTSGIVVSGAGVARVAGAMVFGAVFVGALLMW